MVDFNGFDKGVIGRKLPSDTTLACMKKSDLISLLHDAEDNHRVLAETYKIAVDTSKCKTCPLGLDKRRADEIRAETIDEFEKRLLAGLIPMRDKKFDIAKGTKMPERYTYLKVMDALNMIIEMVKMEAEDLKEQNGERKFN